MRTAFMALAREDVGQFIDLSIAAVEGHRVHRHKIHRLILDSLNCCLAAGKHCVLVLPPEHGKTTSLIPWLIWQRGKREGLRIGTTSADIDLAQKNLTRIRKTILHDQTQMIFPSMRPDESQSKARGEWSKQRLYLQGDVQPGFEAYPFEGAAEGTRVDLLWLDDVITRSCKESQADRERTHGVIHGTWLNRITGNGIAIFTNNVWHREDSIHKASQSPAFHTLWVGYNGTDSMYWRCHNPAEGWPHGEGGTLPLWKPVWPKERLESKQSADRLFYKQMFGGKAMLAEECRFPPSDQWARYTPEEAAKARFENGGQLYAVLDPSGGKKVKDNDFAALVLTMIDKSGKVFVLDCKVERMTASKQVAALWEMDKKWRDAGWGAIRRAQIELLPKDEEFIKPTLLDHARKLQEAGEESGWLPWSVLYPVGSKETRIDALVPHFETGRVLFPKNLERWMGESASWTQLVNQLEDFPLGDHDDAPDALAAAVKLAIQGGPELGIPSKGRNWDAMERQRIDEQMENQQRLRDMIEEDDKLLTHTAHGGIDFDGV